MNDLLKLAVTLVEAGAVRQTAPSVPKVAGLAVIAGAAACSAVAGVACALAALWIYAEPRVGSVGAPLVVAGVLMLLALLAVGLVRLELTSRWTHSPAPDVKLSALLHEATHVLKEHRGPILAAALLAGLIAGSSEK